MECCNRPMRIEYSHVITGRSGVFYSFHKPILWQYWELRRMWCPPSPTTWVISVLSGWRHFLVWRAVVGNTSGENFGGFWLLWPSISALLHWQAEACAARTELALAEQVCAVFFISLTRCGSNRSRVALQLGTRRRGLLSVVMVVWRLETFLSRN